jgi:hypothetical protein
MTAKRAAAIALAAATLGLGATTSAQAETIGGGTTITTTNGKCSVLPTLANGYVTVQPIVDDDHCVFSLIGSSSRGSFVFTAPLTTYPWIQEPVGPSMMLTGCVFGSTSPQVCDPIN